MYYVHSLILSKTPPLFVIPEQLPIFIGDIITSVKKVTGVLFVRNLDFFQTSFLQNLSFFFQMPIVDLTNQGASTSNSRPSGTVDIHSDSDQDFEDPHDMMDDDDNIFVSDKALNSKRIQPLIPDDYGSDDAMAAIRFAEEFSNRYGQPHPMFFPGSLDDAIRESCNQPAKDVMMLNQY